MIWIFTGCELNKAEKRRQVFSTVDDESSIKDFVTTVLRIDLGKAKDFTIGKFSAEGLAQSCKIFNLRRAEGKSFLPVICLNIIYIPDRFRFMMHCENILVKVMIDTLQPVSYTHLRAHETVLDLV